VPCHRRVQELGDTEIEELGFVLIGNEYVARLQVTVNDQILVRVMDGGTYLAK
jgi:hypothetical protein